MIHKELAACRSYPLEWWYPGEDRSTGLGRTGQEQKADAAVALRICRELCPMQSRCLNHAMRYKEFGIWGGTTEAQRKTLARRRRGVYTGEWPWSGAQAS